MLKYKTKFSIGELADFRKSDRREDLQREKIQGYPLYGPNLLVKHIESFDIEQKSIGFVKWGASAGKIIKLPEKSSVVWTMGYLIPKTNLVDPDYLYYLLSNFNFTPFIAKSTVQNLYFEEFKDQNLFVHEMKDQKKIGAFLSAIDRLIDNESKKETLLSNNYKRLTGLIFANNNSIANLPKLRFPTYKSPWRTHKFEEIGSLKKGKLLGKSDLSELGKPCILYGELYTIYSKSPIIDEVFSKTNVNKEQLLIGNKFDVLIPSSGETKEDISSAVCLNVSNTLIGGDLNLIRPTKEIRGGFLAYLIRGPLKNKIAKLAQGNSVVHLNYPQLKKIIFTAPEISEQDHIVNLLYKYDRLKRLINQRTQSYIRFKKALIQKLFANKEGNL